MIEVVYQKQKTRCVVVVVVVLRAVESCFVTEEPKCARWQVVVCGEELRRAC